jgi:epoxyqueuosine reductase
LCLEACPTDAFVDARQLDARRCISYLTIEHRGPVPEALRSQVGDWVFGCDVCQDVCPYNRTSLPSGEQTEPFAAGDRWDAMDAAGLLTVGEDAFDEWARGSPVKRPGREGMARNAALVLGNTGDKRHLPVLREAAARHSSETVREAAGWALRRLDETDDE